MPSSHGTLATLLAILVASGCSDRRGADHGEPISTASDEVVEPQDDIPASAPSPEESIKAEPTDPQLPTDPVQYLRAVLGAGSAVDSALHAALAKVAGSQQQGSSSAFAAAERALKDVLSEYPDDERAAIALGLLYSPGDSEQGPDEVGRNAGPAAEALETALKINPSSIPALHRLATLRQNSSLAQAVELREKIVTLQPDDLSARNRLAHLYVEQERLELAESTARKSIEIATTTGHEYAAQEARFVLARVHMARGEFIESERLWRTGAGGTASPHRACAYQGLGQLYRRLGASQDLPSDGASHNLDAGQAYRSALSSYDSEDLEGALHYIGIALKQEPEPAYKVLKGYFLLFEKRYEEAEKLFAAARAEGSNEPGPDVGRGHLDIVGKRYSAARRKLEPALQHWLEHGSADAELAGYQQLVQELANLGMGWVCANQNRHDEALDYFDRILSLQPEDLLALLGTGNSLIALHRLDEAESSFQRVLALDSDNPYALAELGTVRALRGDAEAAESDFRRALARGGEGYTCPYEGLGLLYLQQGRIKEAKQHLQKAIEINPDIEYKKFNGLARIYLQEGRVDEARELLRRSIQNFPYDGEAKELLKTLGQESEKP